jgi:hypothetical protein
LRSATERGRRKCLFLKGKRPAVLIEIRERHIGQGAFDPAAQTEMMLLCKETGFDIVDASEGLRAKADVLITGEAISEFASRHGKLFSVKARVEVKAVDRRTGMVLAADRQTTVAVDLAEQIAGKTGLQQAAADIAERLLPKLVK